MNDALSFPNSEKNFNNRFDALSTGLVSDYPVVALFEKNAERHLLVLSTRLE